MDSLNMPCKVEPAELSILSTKKYSKLYYNKHSIVGKICVYSRPKKVAKPASCFEAMMIDAIFAFARHRVGHNSPILKTADSGQGVVATKQG